MNSPLGSPQAKLVAWQVALKELTALEAELCEAMTEYAQTRAEPPRQLIIEAERKREQVVALFEVAMEALDAQSLARTGQTNFGPLR